jgi:hypothetical protein
MNDTFINPYQIKKSIIPDDIDLYEEYRKIKKKQSNYSSAIRKAIVEEVEKRLNNNIKN